MLVSCVHTLFEMVSVTNLTSLLDPQTINNTHTCLFTMNFDYLASNTPTSCVFQLRLRPEVGISNMPGSPLANSTLLQIVAKSSVATFLAITTISDRSSSATAIVQPDTNFSHSSLPSLSTSYSYASSTTSSLMASSISSPKDLPKRSLSLALGLGLGIPSILAVISISILLAARRRQQRDKQKKSVKSDINAFEKPELDAQENMTIVQGEPRELRSSIDAPYEVEGDTYQVQELEDNMQRARDRIEGSIRHLQELCNEEELRQIVSELDVESVNLKLEQWDRWKII